MSAQQQQGQLPPGWEAHWDAAAGRYVYVDRSTGQSQWEEPLANNGGTVSPPPALGGATGQTNNPRRRQYPTAHLQQGYDMGTPAGGLGNGVGAAGPTGSAGGSFTPGLAGPGLGPSPGYSLDQEGGSGYLNQPQSQAQLQPQPGIGHQGMFTPGVQPGSVLGGGMINGAMSYFGAGAASGGGAGQQGQQQGRQGGYQAGGTGGYGQQQQGGAGYVGAAGGAGVGGITQQFGGMGIGDGKIIPQTLNLIGMQPNVLDLERPPPTPALPPGASCTNSPTANAHYSYQRCTVGAMPTTASIASKSKVPIAMVITPYKTLKDGEEPVPVVTDAVIARCRRCRTYINPFVTFIEGGQRWKCCMCNLSNEVPQLFDWDSQTNQPADRWARAELNHGVVEYIAPSEYLVRPPQPPVYVFVIDVSQNAIQSGMVATAARTILECIDRIPNADNRTKCAVIAVSTALHFFTLPAGEGEPTQLVVSDLEDVYLPMPNDLLINITESRPALESLLNRLSDMFKDSLTVGNAIGPAMQAAHKLISAMGGKIMTLTATLPTLGEGALKPRDDPKLLGTSKEASLLQSAASFYKSFSIECSKNQVTVDMFLFSSSYTDVASLRCLPRYTGGQVYYYPGFTASRAEDAIKFAAEFSTVLTSPICLEAVIRARTSRGIRLSEFHGNFFTRSTDLLSLPTISMDQSYAIELQIEDPLTVPFVVLQTGILHTTCFGERRIRVITTAIPTTSNISEIIGSIDQNALVNLLANKAVERAMTSKLEDARDAIFNKVVDILTVYKNQSTAAGSGASAQLAVPENLKLLPLLACAMVKHVGFRESTQIPPDLRAYAHALLTTLPTESLIPYLHPRFYSLHNMPANAGTIGEDGLIMPTPLNLTSERLERHGLFLIEDSQTIFLWVGQEAVPQLIQDVFDLPNYAELRGGKFTLPLLDNPFSQRVNAIISKSREMRSNPYWQHLYVVKADAEPPLRNWALSLLIEDRVDRSSSYSQFLGLLKDKVNGSS